MTVSHTVRDSVRRALATSALALLGAGGTAAYAQQATTAQPNGPQVSAAKASTAKTTTAKTIATKTPIVLAQASTVPQATSSSSAAPIQLETVVVTGTLISRPAAETAEAITILKADTLKDQGVENVEQALNMLTSNAPAINIASAVGSFSGGGTYANLRDLGTARTLVLLDGQRLATNAFNGNAVDLSGIPFSAIDSVQVLREGASALYGSDAIAGVINFITKKNYQGAEVQANFDHPQEAGGGSGEADFTFGHGDLASDGYNFMITGSYSKQQELRATQRAFSAEGFDPARGIPATNNPGSWPGQVHGCQREPLAVGLSGLRGQSAADRVLRRLLIPVFRRDGSAPGVPRGVRDGVLHQGAAGQQPAAAAVLLYPIRSDRLLRSHVL